MDRGGCGKLACSHICFRRLVQSITRQKDDIKYFGTFERKKEFNSLEDLLEKWPIWGQIRSVREKEKSLKPLRFQGFFMVGVSGLEPEAS